jgi:hypothetical protein
MSALAERYHTHNPSGHDGPDTCSGYCFESDLLNRDLVIQPAYIL